MNRCSTPYWKKFARAKSCDCFTHEEETCCEKQNDIGLETVHRGILRMRMEESLGRLDGMADEMREKGVMERLPQIIAEVRAQRRAQA